MRSIIEWIRDGVERCFWRWEWSRRQSWEWEQWRRDEAWRWTA